MNIDIKKLEDLYEKDKHKTIIKRLTEFNQNDLPFELKLHLARAYNNEFLYDKAINLLSSEIKNGEIDAFWNYLMCFSFYGKAMKIWPNIHLYKGENPLVEAFEYMTKAKYYNEIGLKINAKSERLFFLKPHITDYHKEIEKQLAKSKRPKPKRIKITKKEYEAKFSKIFDDYFDKISSDTLKLHRTVDSWNWDNDYKYLFLIAKNKNTDIGTALMLFWQGQPLDYWFPYESVSEAKKQHRESFELTELLYQNIVNDFYTRGSVAYNPKNDYGRDWTEGYDQRNSPKKLGFLFFQKTEGKKVKSVYTEGFPDGVWNKIDKLDQQFHYE